MFQQRVPTCVAFAAASIASAAGGTSGVVDGIGPHVVLLQTGRRVSLGAAPAVVSGNDGTPRKYEQLGAGTAIEEGIGLGASWGVSLAQCEEECDSLAGCNSFAFCGSSCFFKNTVLNGTEEFNSNEWCSTYYAAGPADPPSLSSGGLCEDFCTEKCEQYANKGWCQPTSDQYDFMKNNCCAACGGLSATCGIAVNVGQCDAEREYLESLDFRAAGMACMGYGGKADPCTLSITNDPDFGMAKDPGLCLQDVFFLWDEPDTMCDRGWGSCGTDWASLKWKDYVDAWGPSLAARRAKGMKITTPLMKSGSIEALLQKFNDFYGFCPECNQPDSEYFVDVLAFNAFAIQSPPSPYPVAEQYDYLKELAAGIKDDYPGRLVYATNFGTLFAHTAFDQAAALTSYSMLAPNISNIDKIYYFAAMDYCGAPDCTTHNFLQDVVEQGEHAGKTLGQVLVEACIPPLPGK
jgi:hypothetical protein